MILKIKGKQSNETNPNYQVVPGPPPQLRPGHPTLNPRRSERRREDGFEARDTPCHYKNRFHLSTPYHYKNRSHRNTLCGAKLLGKRIDTWVSYGTRHIRPFDDSSGARFTQASMPLSPGGRPGCWGPPLQHTCVNPTAPPHPRPLSRISVRRWSVKLWTPIDLISALPSLCFTRAIPQCISRRTSYLCVRLAFHH